MHGLHAQSSFVALGQQFAEAIARHLPGPAMFAVGARIVRRGAAMAGVSAAIRANLSIRVADCSRFFGDLLTNTAVRAGSSGRLRSSSANATW